MLSAPSLLPRCTYRLQFTPEFGFDEARRLVPYLEKLGVSDLYASPIFQASTSSSHGYDVNDYNKISAALGGRPALDRLSTVLKEKSLGLLIDFVPNHMGIDGEHNSWWRHVLENGVNSRFAPYFDIEWHPRLERLQDRVLVPMLGDQYGTVLESGSLSLAYAEGYFFVKYGRLKLPLRPKTYGLVLERIVDLLPSGDSRKTRLRELTEAFEKLPTHDPDERDALLGKTHRSLADVFETDEPLRDLLRDVLTQVNGVPGDAVSFGTLHELLEEQHYRLAHWKVGAHEVNYRRFFAVDTLVGLKMEEPGVFAATHGLLADLLASQTITGIRLDHIDGLWNPAEYLDRLKKLTTQVRSEESSIYTLVEKILARGEDLPESWAVHGTTGYEFAACLIDLFLDSKNETAWTKIYKQFTGECETSRDLTYSDKLFALQHIFPNAVSNLATELDSLIEPDWHWRDLSLHDLKTALRHLLACLPVYRTYLMPDGAMAENEKQWLAQAEAEAVSRNPCVDPLPLRFLVRVLTGDYPAAGSTLEQRQGFARWACKFQQATGAVMAKSVEDTHFYRYVRMLAANEVGSHPSHFGQPVSAFHEANRYRLEHTPFCQLTTSTHDTKWSEDARARLCALAELPDEWQSHLANWQSINQHALETIDGRQAPDARETYALYQILLAAWPLGMTQPDDSFRNRVKGYFLKAQAEAKLNTTWVYPHTRWQLAGEHFIDTILDSPDFLTDFLPFAQRIAERGMIFSLSQVVLKLTVPGVPDIYQGNEIWDFSLVDPDNRRAVDFDSRMTLLDQTTSCSPTELLKNWQDGGIKMKVTQALLQCRKHYPDLFAKGDYIPQEPTGTHADKIVTFCRRHQTMELLVIVPRHLGDVQVPALGTCWFDTFVPFTTNHKWTNIFTNEPFTVNGGKVSVASAFKNWPVCVLLSS